MLELSDILREHWSDYQRANRSRLVTAHYRAVRQVLACRTPELGGRLYQCAGCKNNHFAYHSCNHRNCPRCGSLGQAIWTAKQEAKLLPVPSFMVTFTMPSELRPVCAAHPGVLYDLMLKESAGALADVARTKLKSPRGQLANTSVLHTWGRQIQHHPHIHAIVPAAMYCPDRDELIRPPDGHFLVHFLPLAERFRNRLREALRTQHPKIYQTLTNKQLRALSPAQNWNVQVKHVGSGQTALRYLARYVQRSAFHPKRLLGYDKQGRILLRWTSSQTGQTAVLALHPREFIRRWLQHVLPKGFARIRHYGFASSAAVKTRARVRLLLGCGGPISVVLPEQKPFTCPCCGGELKFLRELERLTRNLFQRGPPRRTNRTKQTKRST